MGHVSNEELEASLGKLLGAGARLEARVVAHLAEVEARRLHLLVGCSSLYDYCRKRLGLSDYEAFVRIAAARVARKYPLVFGMLDRRQIHLSGVCEVRDFLTPENHRALLEEVSGKTKLQTREVLRAHFPLADIPARMQKLPALEPLAPGRYHLQLTISREQKDKLERARDLLSHANPEGDLAVVVERALDVLIARLEQRRFGHIHPPKPPLMKATPREPLIDEGPIRSAPSNEVKNASVPAPPKPKPKPEPKPDAPKRQHITHWVRRQVVARDGARCAFVGDDGQRCEARAFLQFHHRHPWARGGREGSANLELLCHAHNRLRAEQDFGEAHMANVGDGVNASRPAKRK